MTLAVAKASAVAHWPLNEVSGTRTDSIGGLDLTDNASTASATGKFGNAADFEVAGTSDYLSHADHATLDLGDTDWLIRCWVRFESLGADRVLVAKQGFGTNKSYVIRYDSGFQRIQLEVRGATGTTTIASFGAFGAIAIDTDYLVHAWHDATNNQIGIALNAGTAVTASHSDGVNNSTADFMVGHELGGEAGYHDGLIEDLVILDGYILDATERAEDYNSGTGVAFADWDAAGAAEIAPNAATHAHAATSPTITQEHVLSPADASHGHTATSPAVTQTHAIGPDSAQHAHAATSPAISQVQAIEPDDALHGHAASSPLVTTETIIEPASGQHAHQATSPSLSQVQIVSPESATHAHAATSPALTQVHIVTPSDCLHAHLAGEPVIFVGIIAPKYPGAGTFRRAGLTGTFAKRGAFALTGTLQRSSSSLTGTFEKRTG